MMKNLLLVLAAFAASACSATTEQEPDAMPTLTGDPPIIIAHRGASGERPEHTLAAYELAIEQGADFIEPDLVLTKDGVLVARHENEISGTTDVANRREFADRKTVKVIDGQEVAGWFTEDFTLLELKNLRAKERLPDLREANTKFDGKFEIPTFEEILQLLKAHEEKTGKRVGVYPETKHPGHFASIGLPHEASLLALLSRYGFEGANDPVFIQSFEVGNLKALNVITEIRLVQLIAEDAGPPDSKGKTFASMITREGLREIAEYADGIGPSKNLIIGRNALGQLTKPTGLVKAAHKAGLLVHPWTFRRENYFLPVDFKSGVDPRDHGDLESEVRAFIAAGIDGLFSDNPAQAAAAAKNQY